MRTEFEGPARQGDPAYSRNHLLTDPRFAQYFHDHPDLWESIKRGDTRLNFKAIFTRTPDGPPLVRDFPFDLTTSSGGSEVRDALQARIDALDSASAPPRPNIPEGLAGSCDIASDGDGEAMMVRVVGRPPVVMTAVRVRLVGDMMRGVLDD